MRQKDFPHAQVRRHGAEAKPEDFKEYKNNAGGEKASFYVFFKKKAERWLPDPCNARESLKSLQKARKKSRNRHATLRPVVVEGSFSRLTERQRL